MWFTMLASVVLLISGNHVRPNGHPWADLISTVCNVCTIIGRCMFFMLSPRNVSWSECDELASVSVVIRSLLESESVT